MQEILKKWEDFAKADLDAAKRLFESIKPTSWTYLLCLWHCHQAIEKALKMIIISKNKELLKIHDLPRLAELSELDLSKKQENFLEELNGFYLRSRYPDMPGKPLPKVNKNITELFLKQAKQFFIWTKKQK